MGAASIIAGCLAALVALTSLGMAGPNPNSNQLYGFINANRTLTLGPPGPVYDVIGDVVVLPGVTLTIEPGVVLRMAATDTLQGGDYPTKVEMTIQGTLVADGTAGDSIQFVPMFGGTQQWGSLKSVSSGSMTVRKAVIRGATTGIAAQGTLTIVSNSTISDAYYGVSVISQASVLNVSVLGCVYGISARNSVTTIQQCTIIGRSPLDGGIGIDLSPESSTAPPDSLAPVPTVVSNFGLGVRLDHMADVTNVVVFDNLAGIAVYNGFGQEVRYCTVVRSSGHGIAMGGGSVINAIVAQNAGYGVLASYTNYCDVWANGQGSVAGGQGPYVAGFNPFFVDPANNDFHLASHSVFKNYSNTGMEIGAYGPGGGPPVNVQQTSWGRLKRLYR